MGFRLNTIRPALGVAICEASRLGFNLAVDLTRGSNHLVRRRGVVGDDVALERFQEGSSRRLALSGASGRARLATLLVDRFQNMVARAAHKAGVALAVALHTVASTRRRAKTLLGIAGAGLELAIGAFETRVARALAAVADAILVAVVVASPVLAAVTREQRRARALTGGARSHTRAVEGATRFNGAVLSAVALEALADTGGGAHTHVLSAAVLGAREGGAGVA